VGSATGSSRGPELAAALHRLRSTLARATAELELAALDGAPIPAERVLADLKEALALLGSVETAALGLAPVLVLDDDARLAELTARGLRRLGYDAGAATALPATGLGSIVVFDLGLAGSLSPEARAALRAARPIVVTGAVDPRSRALAAALGASDYLVKPVEVEDLAAAIDRRLAERDGGR
jgi:CheY-like chemotaxis protein